MQHALRNCSGHGVQSSSNSPPAPVPHSADFAGKRARSFLACPRRKPRHAEFAKSLKKSLQTLRTTGRPWPAAALPLGTDTARVCLCVCQAPLWTNLITSSSRTTLKDCYGKTAAALMSRFQAEPS